MEKIIHAIWLGGKKTKLATRCLASWKQYAPDWKIVEHNELEIDEHNAPKFVKEAIRTKKWAFASDYFRFVVLEREGGVYFDYDLELIAPFNPPAGEWCAGEWLKFGGVGPAPGAGIALEKGSKVAKKMLEIYQAEDFDGKTTVGDLMSKNGIEIKVLEPEVMCPYDWEHKLHQTAKTRAIHHYALSWISAQRRIAKWFSWHGLGRLVNWMVELKNR